MASPSSLRDSDRFPPSSGRTRRARRSIPARIVLLLCALVAAPAAAGAQQPNTFRLEGMVCDRAGKPIPAASIRVLRGDQQVAHTGADAGGVFVVGRLPRTELIVEAQAAGYARAQQTVSGWSTDGLALAELVLPAGRRVVGTVVGPDGRPVPGAAVAASGADEAGCHAVASATGQFVFDALPLGAVAVFAWAPGFVTSRTECSAVGDARVQVQLRAGGGRTLRFSVRGATAAQLAAAQCELEARQPFADRPSLFWCLPRGATRNQAREPDMWEITDLPADLRYTSLELRVPGAVTSPAHYHGYFDGLPDDLHFVVEAPPHQVVRGILYGIDHAPLGGVGLEAVGDHPVTTVTAADGTFAFELPIAAFDYFTLRSVGTAWTLHDDRSDTGRDVEHAGCYYTTAAPGYLHRVAVRPAATLHGRVVAADDKPVPFVRVQLRALQDRIDVLVATTGTDRNGDFDLCGLDGQWPHDYRIVADGHSCRGHSPPLQLPREGMEDLLDIQLEPTATVCGQLRAANGAPMAGARIVLRLATERTFHSHECQTDTAGRFRFPGLDPGTYVVEHFLGYQKGGVVSPQIKVDEGATVTQDLKERR